MRKGDANTSGSIIRTFAEGLGCDCLFDCEGTIHIIVTIITYKSITISMLDYTKASQS